MCFDVKRLENRNSHLISGISQTVSDWSDAHWFVQNFLGRPLPQRRGRQRRYIYRRVEKTIEPDMLEQRTPQTTLEPQRFVWVCLSQRKLEPELGF